MKVISNRQGRNTALNNFSCYWMMFSALVCWKRSRNRNKRWLLGYQREKLKQMLPVYEKLLIWILGKLSKVLRPRKALFNGFLFIYLLLLQQRRDFNLLVLWKLISHSTVKQKPFLGNLPKCHFSVEAKFNWKAYKLLRFFNAFWST